MIFSTTAQIVWKESYQRIYEDESGNNLFYKAVDPLSGNNEEKYFVNPIGFIDKQETSMSGKPNIRIYTNIA